ncbi:hypothetical protein CH296_19715 [Rhodococcus sp. 14-2496-1d]|nr:hypothetical protein CH296_19715 [Rhodococcus sp. 14-2496-1d]
MGTAVGAVAGSAASLLAPLINWKTEKQRLVVEKQNAKELAAQQHGHEIDRLRQVAEAAELTARRQLTTEWRNGLAESMKAFHTPMVAVRPLSGKHWFETLRPYLNADDTNIKVDLVNPVIAEVDEWKGRTLSDEITRIARQWGVLE